MPKLSVVITADSRAGWLDAQTSIYDRGDGALCGCRSVDFMLAGIENKVRFLTSPGIELETIVCIDEREPISPDVMAKFDALIASNVITKLVVKKQDHSKHRWNDALYISACRHATGSHIAKWDGDIAAFRRPDFDVVKFYLEQLEKYKFICQPTQIENHGMTHASTRFFICKKSSFDLDELERCLNDEYRARRIRGKHCPTLEHIIGALAGENQVLYPPAQNDQYIIFCWVRYRKGLLAEMNAMSYDEIYDFVFNKGSSLHGASDFIPGTETFLE